MPTDTSQDQEKPQRPPLLSAIPMFATPPSQKLDPPLPEVNSDDRDAPQNPSTDPRNGNPSAPSEPTSPNFGVGTSHPSSTSDTEPRLKPGGNPAEVSKVIGGLLVIAVTVVGILARRSERDVRKPTPAERDDIARPLARIAVRHLPLDVIGPDLADATEAAVATHNYVMAGPLVVSPHPELEPLFADDFEDQEP